MKCFKLFNEDYKKIAEIKCEGKREICDNGIEDAQKALNYFLENYPNEKGVNHRMEEFNNNRIVERWYLILNVKDYSGVYCVYETWLDCVKKLYPEIFTEQQ